MPKIYWMNNKKWRDTSPCCLLVRDIKRRSGTGEETLCDCKGNSWQFLSWNIEPDGFCGQIIRSLSPGALPLLWRSDLLWFGFVYYTGLLLYGYRHWGLKELLCAQIPASALVVFFLLEHSFPGAYMHVFPSCFEGSTLLTSTRLPSLSSRVPSRPSSLKITDHPSCKNVFIALTTLWDDLVSLIMVCFFK